MLYVTAHPSGTRKRREKGRGKEPEVLRGETHPAAPWSRSAAGLPRGITLWRVPAPDGWAPWAALLALVLIKQIKQRHSSPGPRGSAAPGNPRRLRGMPVPLLSQPGGLKNGLDGAKTQQEAHGGVREVLPVTRGWDGVCDLWSTGLKETLLLCVGITDEIRGSTSGEDFGGRKLAHWRLPQALPSGT